MQESFSTLMHSQAEELAWQFILAALDIVQAANPDASAHFLSLGEGSQRVVATDTASDATCLWLDDAGQWCRAAQLPAVFHAACDLYLPVLGGVGDQPRLVAHLGQSVDAQIAARSGDSFYVTGEENRKHLHCLRALSDAVIVGAGTVVADNPQLTTRSVTGKNPVRVVIDPQARLREPLGLFDDAQARTILLHQSSTDLTGRALVFGPTLTSEHGSVQHQVERWVVPDTDEELSVQAIVDLLALRDLHRLFIEGGGITVSKFYKANVLDRLHVAIAPLLAGQGIGALQLPGVEVLADARRPPCALYRMGEDILWDFDLSSTRSIKGTLTESVNSTPADNYEQYKGLSLERIY